MVLGVMMDNLKELISIDLSSYTIITTGIAVLFSILITLLIGIGIGIIRMKAIYAMADIAPTIILCTLIYSVYNSFCKGFLYNVLTRILNSIKITLNEKNEITSISSVETAIIISVIGTIQAILIYLATILIFPLYINALIGTFMYEGNDYLAMTLYQFLMIVTNPIVIILIIVSVFIISFVLILIATSIYNAVASQGYGVVVNLSKESEFTAIDSIDAKKLAMISSIICGVINLVIVLISVLIGAKAPFIILGSCVGFVIGYIIGALIAIFYNFLAKRVGKLKIELIDI